MEMQLFGVGPLAQSSIFFRFDGLNEEQDYTVSISTELDGKTITQVTALQTEHSFRCML